MFSLTRKKVEEKLIKLKILHKNEEKRKLKINVFNILQFKLSNFLKNCFFRLKNFPLSKKCPLLQKDKRNFSS